MKRLLLVATTLLSAGCAETATRPVPPPASVAEQPQPSPAVREAQQQLQRSGFYAGAIDGLWGPETQLAVERFQQSRGLEPTGRLNAATENAIRASANAPPPPPLAALQPTDATSVRTLQNRLRQLGFYNGPAEGVWGPETQTALERFQRSRRLEVTGQVTPATLTAMGIDPASFAQRSASGGEPLDPSVVRSIQRRLRQAGFYNGPLDGNWGPGSRAALERFQRSRGLDATGGLNPTTLAALGLDPNNLAASAEVARGGSGSSTRR